MLDELDRSKGNIGPIDPPSIFSFGEFRLSPSARLLAKGDETVALGGRALDLLIVLVQRAGQVLTKAELFGAVWPGAFMDDSNLRVTVAALRKALGDSSSKQEFVASVPGRGYAFVAPVLRKERDGADPAPAPSKVSKRLGHFPIPLVGLIGREEIVTELSGQLLRFRLLTITGTGGIGKTAVALAVVHALSSHFPHDVALLDLGALETPRLLAPQLASLFRIPAPDPDPLEQIIAFLRTRRALIVFDNCEHMIDQVGILAETLLQGAPHIHVLATSREPLRTAGERVYRLAPLEAPPASANLRAEEALRYPAVRLFVERARACDNSFKMTDEVASTIAEICIRLDGLPLAIELAAARASLFGLHGLANRLDDRFEILTKGRRTALPRHQTLSAMVDWSYETLTEAERIVWRRLAAFRGAFTIEAADAIANNRPFDDYSIVDALDSLVEKSLVSVEHRDSEAKYRLLESLRIYAFSKLSDPQEARCVRQRHAQFWYARSADSGDNWIETPTAEWLSKHSNDVADIRAALDWAFSSDGDPILGVKITAASAPLWFKVLMLPEFRVYLRHAIEVASQHAEVSDPLVMRLHVALAHATFHALGSNDDVVLAE